MSLTREECEKGLQDLLIWATNGYCALEVSDKEYPYLKGLFEQLIKEHFDNPPLKFEELEVGMWVWDNKEKVFYELWLDDEWEYLPTWKFIFYEDCLFNGISACKLDWEENRYFRKQVAE